MRFLQLGAVFLWPIILGCSTAPTGPYTNHKFTTGDVITNGFCTGTVVDIFNFSVLDENRYKVKDVKCTNGKEYYYAIFGENGFRRVSR